MRGSGTKTVAGLLVAALLVAPLSAVAVVGLIRYQDASDDDYDADTADREPAPVELAALLEPSFRLRSALGGEMAWQATRTVGYGDAMETPGPDSMRQTDEAVAAAGASAGSGEAEALAAATNALAALADLRAEADAIAGSGVSPGIAQIPVGTAMQDRYLQMLDAYDAQVAEAITGFADPDLRLAATLSHTASGLARDFGSLISDLLLATVDGSGTADEPDEVAELAAGRADVAAVLAELQGAPAPYDAIVADADLEAFGELLAHVDAALAGEPIVAADVLVPLARDPLLTLDREIVAAYDAQTAAAASAAADMDADADTDGESDDDDRTRSLALAVAGAVGALFAVAIVIAQAARLRRATPPESPTSGPPPPPPPPPAPTQGLVQ